MVLDIAPSADLHLAMTERYKRLTLYALSHGAGGSVPIVAANLIFKIDGYAGQAGADHILDNGRIAIHVMTGEVTARQASSDPSFVRVTYNEPLGQNSVRPWSVPVRIVVHDDLPTLWIGNNHASMMAGTDAFVPTVYAINGSGAVVDVTGHGFVTLSLDSAVDGCDVHPIAGRVTASEESAGTTLVINVVDNAGNPVGQLPVAVTPGVRELPDETDSVRAARAIVEELPFSPSDTPPRRNILILAEGFARNSEHHFRRVALKMARRLRKRRVHEPFHMLRDDYRLWMAFAESPQNGITVTTRVNQSTGNLGDITDLDATRRLLQVHDSPFGLAFGRRAGDIPFSPDQSASPPDAKDSWTGFEHESEQPLKDSRRLPRNRSEWNRSMIEWFSTLRRKEPTGNAAADRIGETWGPGGPDQGLVIVLVNDEIHGGRFEPGEQDSSNGYLFGSSSLGSFDRVGLKDASPSFDHEPSNVIGAGNYNARMERTLGAIHELAHGLFLGDESGTCTAFRPGCRQRSSITTISIPQSGLPRTAPRNGPSYRRHRKLDTRGRGTSADRRPDRCRPSRRGGCAVEGGRRFPDRGSPDAKHQQVLSGRRPVSPVSGVSCSRPDAGSFALSAAERRGHAAAGGPRRERRPVDARRRRIDR